ncbi:MAG: tetratricopeptide repeat-containing sulfotransferase family protein [Planctomycetota bacterium]
MSNPELSQLHQQAFAALQRRDYDGAASLAHAMMDIKPTDLYAQIVLAQIAQARWRYTQALEHQARVVQMDPKNAQYRIDLANLYTELGNFTKALPQFDKALKLDPGNVFAVSGKVGIYASQNKYDRALRLLKPYITSGSPPPEIAWILLQVLVREKRYDEAIEIGRRVLDATMETNNAIRTAWFELARAYERSGNIEEAFEAATRGNSIDKLPFSAESNAARIDGIISTFTPELLQRLPRPSEPSEEPIFIVGIPRCGSTLTERIIHAHPLAFGAGEHIAMFRLTDEIAQRMGSSQPYPQCCRELTQPQADALAAAYLADVREGAPVRAERVANKDLGNFFHLGLIDVLFPKGRVIHCRRDAVDTCLSCYMEPLPPRMVPFASDLEALGRYHVEYQRLMDYWRDVISVPFLEVDYEELVTNPDETSRRIIDFCGLPWDDACLKFHEVKRTERTLSHDQVRKPVYRSSVGRAERFGARLDPLRVALATGGT